MTKPRTIFGVTSYDMGCNAGFVVHCLFNERTEAEKYASEDGEYSVEEFTLYDESPAPYQYWHRGAEVYPDGSVEDWFEEHQAQPPREMEAADGHLGAWDGHAQGHCGLHISIFGTNKGAIEELFLSQLAGAVDSMSGACPRCGKTDDYQSGHWGETRKAMP